MRAVVLPDPLRQRSLAHAGRHLRSDGLAVAGGAGELDLEPPPHRAGVVEQAEVGEPARVVVADREHGIARPVRVEVAPRGDRPAQDASEGSPTDFGPSGRSPPRRLTSSVLPLFEAAKMSGSPSLS